MSALTAKLASFLLGAAAPHSRGLIRREREVQTGFSHLAPAADGLRRLDTVDRGAAGADREEQLGIEVAALRLLSPSAGVEQQCSVCDH